MKHKCAFLVAALICGLIATGCGGATGSPGTTNTGNAQGPDTAIVASSPTYTPGQPLTIVVSVVPDNDSVAYAVEDAPPTGWTVSNINEAGTFDSDTGKVKWGLFFDQCPRILTYTVTPPSATTGQQSFVGTLSVNGSDFSVTGQRVYAHS